MLSDFYQPPLASKVQENSRYLKCPIWKISYANFHIFQIQLNVLVGVSIPPVQTHTLLKITVF